MAAYLLLAVLGLSILFFAVRHRLPQFSLSNPLETPALAVTPAAVVQINDASRLNATDVAEILAIHSETDIQRALEKARKTGKHISLAGRRHSMGGQTFARGNIILDMLPFNQMKLDPKTQILIVQPGSTWSQVQQFLDQQGRSVHIMQSDNIFSVGGTVSVNAHGWQPRNSPIASSVKGFRLMLASGEVKTCSRDTNADLFRAVLGGYGLLGVLLDVQLQTVQNEAYRFHPYYFEADSFPAQFQSHVANNPGIGLAYGRLSVDKNHFLEEAYLGTYERLPVQPAPLGPMQAESSVSLKNSIFRASERTDAGKRRRWLLEKEVSRLMSDKTLTRNTVMNPDIHVLWPRDLKKYDILHEYFIPYENFAAFVAELRRLVPAYHQNLLNATLRDVRADRDTLIPYATRDVCAIVLFFSQSDTPDAEKQMRTFTQAAIDAALRNNGSFYLPYRLHYTSEQLHRAYPGLNKLFTMKARYDPQTLFTSQFYDYLKNSYETDQKVRRTF